MANMTPGAIEGDNEKITTVIADDLEIKGTVRFESSLMTKGVIEGEIISQGLLVVGPTAKVTATITTKSLVSHGEINGDVTASDKAVLKKTAVHRGNITTPSIIVEGGSVFNGSCIMQKRPRDLSAATVKDFVPENIETTPTPAPAPAWAPAPAVEEKVEEVEETSGSIIDKADEAEVLKQEEFDADEDHAVEAPSEELSLEGEGEGEEKADEYAAKEEKKDEGEKTDGIWTFNDGEYPKKPKLF